MNLYFPKMCLLFQTNKILNTTDVLAQVYYFVIYFVE